MEIACDTEDDSKGKTYIVNFFDGFQHYSFRENTEGAVNWLIEYSKRFKKGVVVWFANTQYDIGNLFRESQESLSFTVSGSRFITGKVYLERIQFKDILNVIPGASVKKLGKMINLPKLDHGTDFNNLEYCQRDTEIVFWALKSYRKTLAEMGVTLKNTAASTAFFHLLETYPALAYNNFSAKLPGEKEELDGREVRDWMRQGYYGGRTEVFNLSHFKTEVHAYDVVSMYPSIMTEVPLVDTRYRKFTLKPNLKKEGMCECTVQTPSLDIPYLPLKRDGKLLFPTGTFRGIWTYFELREAKKLGYEIKEVHRALEFQKTFDFTMQDFVEKFHTRRKQAKQDHDETMTYACKILLNSPYGKFAMGNDNHDLIPLHQLEKRKGEFAVTLYPNGQVSVKTIGEYAPSTNYLTAAMITAMARHKLYQYLRKGNENGRTLIYCDTDSVFFSGNPFSIHDANLGENLGDLEKQYRGDKITEAHFLLPKTYMLRFKSGAALYKCKGVKEALSEQFFTKGYATGMSPLKYVETCRKNFQRKEKAKKTKTRYEPLPFNLWVEKPKSMQSDFDKRVVLEGGATRPIFFLDNEPETLEKEKTTKTGGVETPRFKKGRKPCKTRPKFK